MTLSNTDTARELSLRHVESSQLPNSSTDSRKINASLVRRFSSCAIHLLRDTISLLRTSFAA